MSKSIYEEALDIIDRNIFELPEGFGILYEIRERIKQAQKQEKLLELYKELSKYVCEQCYAHKLPEITRLKIIIGELEQ